ncbi:MAG: monofunctional biosynthetic peptidoglycan transglycosylase [Candidatus Marinimicrobia bacterium]|nr:monofunctional biosynthetic peptidoglycan transglycosylase [Candidatus Neomarinimicrobiota bacterium]
MIQKIRKILFWIVTLAVAYFIFCIAGLLYLKFADPVATMVQMQRRVEATLKRAEYRKLHTPVPLSDISLQLRRAVIAAEDGRFYQHGGVDWQELGKVWEKTQNSGEPMRGASTITQQLVKNLFFTTHRSYIRKIYEFSLAPVAEVILGKDRILDLYLNNVEWGIGVYGAEAAAHYYYGRSARWLSKWQSARMAAVLPAPRTRSPHRMDWYAKIIINRMSERGW